MSITPIIGLVIRLFSRSEGSDPPLKMEEAISLSAFSSAFDRPFSLVRTRVLSSAQGANRLSSSASFSAVSCCRDRRLGT